MLMFRLISKKWIQGPKETKSEISELYYRIYYDHKNPMSEWRQKNYLVSHPVIQTSWDLNFPNMNDRERFSSAQL